jgi:chitin deacetylase
MRHLHKNLSKQLRDDIFIVSCALVLVVISSVMAINSHTFEFFGGNITHVDTKEKVVALTFDDGPTNGHIPEVLHTLHTYNVKATFFLIGKQVVTHPEATREIIKQGHEVGNHGYTHRSLVFMPYNQVAREVEATDDALRNLGYHKPIEFRPPYGHKFIFLPWYLHSHDRLTIMWSLAPDDLYKKADDMSAYVETNVKPGSIIILHVMEDHRAEQRKALTQFIPALQKQGYRFVTVDELLSLR